VETAALRDYILSTMSTTPSQPSSPVTTKPRTTPDDALYYEYSKAANPLGAGFISGVPLRTLMPETYADGLTRRVPFDLSADLQVEGAATGPGLLASFLRVLPGETLSLEADVTSQVFYVIRGRGRVEQGAHVQTYTAGAFLALPGTEVARVSADEATAMYHVSDAPLLRYLGVRPDKARFTPVYYPAERAEAELRKVAAETGASERNRVSILLGNRRFPQTRTVTHTIWAMFGLLPPGAVQKPHRHQSIALDFIVHAPRGCYTLVGTELNEDGTIHQPTRVDWTTGMAFTTPPGYWHAHFNESSEEGLLIPIQDAGLQTYLRALDIRFRA
jgi:gentisate 1,2-dioxygenase